MTSPDRTDPAIDATTIDPKTIAQLRQVEALLVIEQSTATGARTALIRRRLRAVRSLLAAELAPPVQRGSAAVTREDRMDAARAARGRHDEYTALLAHARSLPSDVSATPALADTRSKRVVLVHRTAWFRDRVRATLAEAGVDVVAELDDGAQAVGVVLAEQPDLVLVEDLLPSYPGLEVVTRLHQHAPDVLVAVHLADDAQAPAFQAQGVRVSFSRQVPPTDVADGLLRYLEDADRVAVRA